MATQHIGTLLLFFVIFISQINVGDAAGCIESERRALMEFKGSLVDDAKRLSSWTGGNCCSWVGIACNNQSGRVEKLDLRNPVGSLDLYSEDPSQHFSSYMKNSLGGEINHSILDLEGLLYLDLSHNDFYNIQIPAFLGSLKSLKYLNLTHTLLRGEIPPHLGNLSNLEYLSIGTPYSEITLTTKSLNWVTNFPSLKALEIYGTNLNQSLDWWYSINLLPSPLSSLSLRDCYLVPPLILSYANNFTSLGSLDIGNNYLSSSFPLRLFNLTSKLQFLWMDGNHFEDSAIAFMLEKYTSLSVLDLNFNLFSSASTLDLSCNLTSLTYLDLSYNQFNGSFPVCYGNSTSLTELHMEMNKFGGEIPNELCNIKQLTVLDLSFNSFTSSMPSAFGNLRDLTKLRLRDNQLSGVVPSSVGNLSKLQIFDISSNSLVGELSESHFTKLRYLKYLYVSYNRFLGLDISSEWIPPFQLQFIRMDSINIGTQFPLWIQNQKNIKQIYLSNNKIQGSLSSIPQKIEDLNLSDNLLTGLFDSNQMIKSPIRFLFLDKNHLTGHIPHVLCNFSDLVVLSLSNNHLTGQIPSCFGSFRSLRVLNLANNSLSGCIPSTLGNIVNLNYLHLSRNNLSTLKKLTVLVTLNLGDNQLWGTLPEWIGQEFSYLRFLRLQSNGFFGNITISLCQLQYLQILNLAQNDFTGQIPHCYANFSAMRVNSDTSRGFQVEGTYTEELENILKGIEQYFSSNLWELKSISLSGNNIDGEIPRELMELDGLQNLNLSSNQLRGRIPEEIGNLKQLESLDLAMNHFSGPIPPSMASIDSLGFLNLSFNNLSGTIPLGNHFQTLITDHSVLQGNSGLCGKPLARSCSESDDVKPNGDGAEKDGDEFDQMLWFYAGVGPGIAVGLLLVLCLHVTNTSWRNAYFGFLNVMCDRLKVTYR